MAEGQPTGRVGTTQDMAGLGMSFSSFSSMSCTDTVFGSAVPRQPCFRARHWCVHPY